MSQILMYFWCDLFVLSENIELISLLDCLEINSSHYVVFILSEMST